MQKNKFYFLKISIFLIFIVLIACLSVFGLIKYRYGVNSPMRDIEYKKSIIRQSHNPFYRLENLRNLVGEEELTELIRANDNNPEFYTTSLENRKKGLYRATLHMHTTNSDGVSSVEHFLDMGQTYAEKWFKDDGYMYIAITDHNTVLGAKELIRVLQKSAKKYPRVKVIAGMEINSKLYSTTVSNEPVEIHVLLWCINPYDKYLNKEFYKKDLKDKWNNTQPERDFEWIISNLSDYGIPGIAHPATYTDYLGDKRNTHIVELFDKYISKAKKVPFTAGYYQTYPSAYYELNNELHDYYKFIEKTAKEKGIIRTGSTDTHGLNIFKRL